MSQRCSNNAQRRSVGRRGNLNGTHGGEARARGVDEAACEGAFLVALVAIHGDAVQVAVAADLRRDVQVFANHRLAEHLLGGKGLLTSMS